MLPSSRPAPSRPRSDRPHEHSPGRERPDGAGLSTRRLWEAAATAARPTRLAVRIPFWASDPEPAPAAHRDAHASPFPFNAQRGLLGDVLPLVAPLAGFTLGVGFAWAASDELARAAGNLAGTRSLIIVTFFGVLVPVPMTAYFLILAQDWSLAYLLEGGRLASALGMGLLLLAAASTPIGFRTAARPAAARNVRAMVGLAAVPALLATALIALVLPRLSVFGTFAQFHGDFGTRPVAGSFVGTALLWMHAVLVAAVVWTIRSLKRLTSRHARR